MLAPLLPLSALGLNRWQGQQLWQQWCVRGVREPLPPAALATSAVVADATAPRHRPNVLVFAA